MKNVYQKDKRILFGSYKTMTNYQEKKKPSSLLKKRLDKRPHFK